MEKVLESIVQNSLDLFRTINHNDNSDFQDEEEGRMTTTMMEMATCQQQKNGPYTIIAIIDGTNSMLLFYDLLLELGGPAVAFEWVSPQVEGDPVKSAPGPEAIVPELNQPDLVEGEVDVEVGALQEVQVAWTDLWILGSQKVVAHVEHLQGEKVYAEVDGYLGQLVVGQVQLDHALKDVRVVGPSVDVVVGQIDLGQPLVAAKKLSWEVEQVVLMEVECFQLLQS